MRKIPAYLILLFFIGCSSSDLVQKQARYTNLYNNEIDGIQEDKLKQAEESFYKGNFSRSLELYNDLLPEFLASDSQEFVINTMFLITSCYTQLSDFPKALAMLQKINERILLVFENTEKNYYKALSAIEMGNLLLFSNIAPSPEYLLGFLYYGQQSADRLNNRYLQMKSKLNLAQYYLNAGTNTTLLKKESQERAQLFASAEEQVKDAFNIANKTRNINYLSRSAFLLGKIYLAQENFANALETFFIAYRLFRLNNYYIHQAKTLIEITEVFFLIEKYSKAFNYALRAFEMISSSNSLESPIKERYLKDLQKKILQIKEKAPYLQTKAGFLGN